MSHFSPRNGRFALIVVVFCLLLGLSALRPAAGIPAKQTAPITPVSITPAPAGIDTSIMSAGARAAGGEHNLSTEPILGVYPASIYLGVGYNDGPRASNGQGQQVTAFPDIKLSITTIGLDVDFQRYENDEYGSGGDLLYAFGTLRDQYSAALQSAINFNNQTPEQRDSDSSDQSGHKKKDVIVKTLGNTLVSYTRGLQTSVVATTRSYKDLGTYTTEGTIVGQLIPLGAGGFTVSGVAQLIQFSPSGGASLPYGSDVQYGASLVWQDRVSSIVGTTAVIRPWRLKIGADYFSKTLGGSNALPDTYDVYFRYKVPFGTTYHPLDLVMSPFYGEAGYGLPGQRRQETYGANIGITVPISL